MQLFVDITSVHIKDQFLFDFLKEIMLLPCCHGEQKAVVTVLLQTRRLFYQTTKSVTAMGAEQIIALSTLMCVHTPTDKFQSR